MPILGKPVEIQFANEKIKDAFEKLNDLPLKKSLEKSFSHIKENPFCGIQIPKRQIPKEYIKKFNIHNVWKYNLTGGWRLIYSIKGGDLVILSIILEWLDHKNYERRFKY